MFWEEKQVQWITKILFFSKNRPMKDKTGKPIIFEKDDNDH
jgi:hypothetical protein